MALASARIYSAWFGLGLLLLCSCEYPTATPDKSREVPPEYRETPPFTPVTSSSPKLVEIEPISSPLPAGTLVVIRLEQTLTPISTRSGDHIPAALEHVLLPEGRVIAWPGSQVLLRIVQAHAPEWGDPGYLRLTLDEVTVRGKDVDVKVRTSSIFVKGKRADLSAGRRLTFRLIAPSAG